MLTPLARPVAYPRPTQPLPFSQVPLIAAAPDASRRRSVKSPSSRRLIAAPAVTNQFEPVDIAVHHAAVGSEVLQCHAAGRETPFEVSADFLP
jgi:hypothetical protein